MTTHPNTGSDPGGFVPEPDGASIPTWLPDEATLNRLAGEFFSSMPGSPGVATLGVAGHNRPASAPTSPGIPGAGGSPAPPPSFGFDSPPLAVPKSPPNGPPSATAATAYATTAAGLGGVYVPEIPALAASVPDLSPDGAPYYFGGLDSPPMAVPTSPPSGPPSTSAATSHGATARSLGGAYVPEVPLPTTAVASAPASDFYFLTEPATSTPAVSAAPNFYFLDRGAEQLPEFGRDPHPAFDVDAVRNDFPILAERVNGHPLVWLDNAATTQKPQSVIDRISYFYAHENSNIHRAAHELAARSTDAYEHARDIVARFIGASSADEIIFVRGATEAINLVAQTWGRKNIRAGDEIVISHLEHHANIVPWQMLAAETGAVIKVIPVDESGQLLMGEYTRLLSDRTKLVSVTHVSNALGTITPVADIVAEAKRAGARVLIDGAQSIPHTKVNMQALGPDFFVFSGHKIFGPTGIGVVYGTSDVLQDMPPWQGGGNMIVDVTLERSIYQSPPGRFEAGTGNIADAVGLGAALEYVERLGIENIAAYEHFLLDYATAGLKEVPGLHLVGTAPEKASVMSFVLDGYAPIEVGKALNEKGIAVRAGHHCAQPILRRFGLEATVRPSLAFYNTCAEVDHLLATLHQLAADAGRR